MLGQLSNMLGAIDLSKNDEILSSGSHNEDELLYKSESSIIDLTMVDDGE